MDVTIKGVPELSAALDRFPAEARAAAARGITRATTLVWRESVMNAPRSPTEAQQSRSSRKTRKDTSSRKKPSAFTRAKPGGLERSVSMSVDNLAAEGSVFVALNSEAGKYARRIHDEKGSTWENRGPGTIAKGPRADDKYIERAIDDNEDSIRRLVVDEMEWLMKWWKR